MMNKKVISKSTYKKLKFVCISIFIIAVLISILLTLYLYNFITYNKANTILSNNMIDAIRNYNVSINGGRYGKREKTRTYKNSQIRAVFCQRGRHSDFKLHPHGGSFSLGQRAQTYLAFKPHFLDFVGFMELHLQPQIHLQIGRKRAYRDAQSGGVLRGILPCVRALHQVFERQGLERISYRSHFHGA